MTREEAIEKLKRERNGVCRGCAHPSMVGWCENHCKLPEAYDMAIEALGQPEIIRKPVVGYEGYYEVDNCGRVYAIDRIIRVEDHGRIYDKPLKGGVMKQHMHSEGYKAVCLTKDGKTKTLFVHRIVATAFLPNPDNLPCVNHKDEDKTNNFVDNIEWCSYQYNNAYGSKPKKHSKRMTGRKQSDEQKARRSESLKRYWANKKAERRTDANNNLHV